MVYKMQQVLISPMTILQFFLSFVSLADAPGPVEATICANKGKKQGCCFWSDTILVMWCPARDDTDEEPYYVYQLKEPKSCNLAYCVEDSCPTGMQWYEITQECIGKDIRLCFLFGIFIYFLYIHKVDYLLYTDPELPPPEPTYPPKDDKPNEGCKFKIAIKYLKKV